MADLPATTQGAIVPQTKGRALVDYEDDAEKICRKAMAIAAEVCVYTNDRLTVESLDSAT